MKRRNFLGWMAGALVAAREAFVGDVDDVHVLPVDHPDVPAVMPTPEPGVREMILNYDGTIIRAAVDSVTIDYRYNGDYSCAAGSKSVTITLKVPGGYSVYKAQGKVSIHYGT